MCFNFWGGHPKYKNPSCLPVCISETSACLMGQLTVENKKFVQKCTFLVRKKKKKKARCCSLPNPYLFSQQLCAHLQSHWTVIKHTHIIALYPTSEPHKNHVIPICLSPNMRKKNLSSFNSKERKKISFITGSAKVLITKQTDISYWLI